MMLPGPEHPFVLEPLSARIMVLLDGEVIADSRRVICLREGNLPPVLFFPPGDVRMAALEPTRFRTHCPYKGDAHVWHVRAIRTAVTAAAWSYDRPHPVVAGLRGYIAFDVERMDQVLEQA